MVDQIKHILLYWYFQQNQCLNIKKNMVLTVPMPDIAGGYSRRIKIKMHFGYTELFVTASEEGTNRKAEAKHSIKRLIRSTR
jgi:hypothetical protein